MTDYNSEYSGEYLEKEFLNLDEDVWYGCDSCGWESATCAEIEVELFKGVEFVCENCGELLNI